MKRSIYLLIICLVVGISVLLSLGFWQVKRLAWKESMIERVEQGMTKPPLPIEEVERLLMDGSDIEYRPAFAEGTFLHEGEQHYFATYKSRVGYFIYTPLAMDDGRRLFVNRGFVPIDLKAKTTRQEGLVDGRVRIEGLARSAPSEKPNPLVPNNDLGKNVYHWKSLSQMAGNAYNKMEFSTMSLFLDAGPGKAQGGWPVGGVTRVTFSNNHLQYAYTWFGLALALIGVGGYFLFGQWSGRKAD